MSTRIETPEISRERPVEAPAGSASGAVGDEGLRPGRRASSPLAWTSIACMLLVVSGVVRVWQGRRLEGSSTTVRNSPFPLSSMAKVVGGWKMLEGSQRSLDPQVAQVSGCTDHILRDYYDEQTGCLVTVLLGYGPGELISGHTPEACFPAAGYAQVADTLERQVDPGDERAKATLRSAVYVNPSIGASSRVEAHYSLRHVKTWNPDFNFKDFRRTPEAYRILVQRHVIESERRDRDDPSENFLAAFLAEFERRLAETEAAGSSPNPSVSAAGAKSSTNP